MDKGLGDAEKVFTDLQYDHEFRLRSIPRRIQVIHDFCTATEIQASRGNIAKDDLEPLPRERDMPDVDFKPITYTYPQIMKNEEVP